MPCTYMIARTAYVVLILYYTTFHWSVFICDTYLLLTRSIISQLRRKSFAHPANDNVPKKATVYCGRNFWTRDNLILSCVRHVILHFQTVCLHHFILNFNVSDSLERIRFIEIPVLKLLQSVREHCANFPP